MVGTVKVPSSFGMDVYAEPSSVPFVSSMAVPVEQPPEMLPPVEQPVGRRDMEIPWELISHDDVISIPVNIPTVAPLAEGKRVGIAEVIDIETLKESRAEAESAKKAKEEKKQTGSDGYTYFGDHGGIPIEKIIEEVEKSF